MKLKIINISYDFLMRTKINFMFILLISFFSINTLANGKVIALGSQTKIKDFKDYLIDHPAYISLSQKLIDQKIQFANALIEDKFNLAVKGLVLKDLTPSIFIFKEITDFHKKSYIFSNKNLNIYSESFYRLANIDRTHSDYWMNKGIYFNPTYKISEEIFNPYIIKEQNLEKTRLHPYFYRFSTKPITARWSRLFINGFEVKNETLIHPSQRYTLLYFREGKIPLQTEHEGTEFQKMQKPKMTSMNFGNCQKPKFFEDTLRKSVDAVFYSKDCIITKNDFNKNLLLSSEAEDSLEIFDSSSDFYKSKIKNINSFTSKNKPLNLSKPLSKKAFFKRKKTWYIITGGLILTSAAHFFKNKLNSKPQIKPVHHEK